MTDCPDAVMRDLLPDYLHDALDARERAAVAAHLAACSDCREELALLEQARRALDRAPTIDLDRIAEAVGAARPAGPRIVGGVAPSARAAWSRGQLWRSVAALLVVAGVSALPFVLQRQARSGGMARGDSVAIAGAPAASDARRTGTAVLAPPPELTFGSGISELDGEALEALILEMDGVDALPHADPAPVLSVDPLGDAGAL